MNIYNYLQEEERFYLDNALQRLDSGQKNAYLNDIYPIINMFKSAELHQELANKYLNDWHNSYNEPQESQNYYRDSYTQCKYSHKALEAEATIAFYKYLLNRKEAP